MVDLGVVLTGTLGLEMALNNVPVVSAGVNPCHGMGLLSEPETVEDYFSFIESGEVFIPNSDELRLFSYFYFIHQCFKWPITERVWGDVNFNASITGCESLCEGRNSVLDIIFDEIFALKDDFVRHK